ncbi:MAG: flippase [Alistipes sp.]|nr:flippase [Alistipes sp.]
MATPSVRNNFLYKSILTLSSYLISLATFPYVSRVLGVEGIGAVNFADNTAGYFILFAMMGVTSIGTREIASAGSDRERRSRIFSRIFGINLTFTLATLLLYFGAILLVPRFSQNADLFYIGSAKIVGTVFLVEWLFTGLEEFRYITLRSMLIKLLYVIAVYLLVNESDDAMLYLSLTVGTVVVNAVVNILYARRFVTLRLCELFSLHYLKENLTLGVHGIMTSMYITFNVVWLGLVANDVQVGLYTTAFKLYTIVLGLFTAFTSVMMPRMSALLAEGDRTSFEEAIGRSFSGMMRLIVPLVVCSVILAPQIIRVVAGEGYEGAILPMRIIMPAALAVGVAQVLSVQVLLPLRHDKVLLAASIVGATASLIINLLVVPHLQSVGSAIVTFVAEYLVTTTYVIYIAYRRLIAVPWHSLLVSALHTIPPAAVSLLCCHLIDNPLFCITAALLLGGGIWALLNRKILAGMLKR